MYIEVKLGCFNELFSILCWQYELMFHPFRIMDFQKLLYFISNIMIIIIIMTFSFRNEHVKRVITFLYQNVKFNRFRVSNLFEIPDTCPKHTTIFALISPGH